VNHQVSGILEQAAVWGDYNKDGYPDLFIGNLQTSGPSFFHRNNGNGTFTEMAATLGFQGAARGAQWIDYNNDGLWDFCIAGYSGATVTVPIKLFRNNGDGTFTDVASSAAITDALISWGVTCADYDNDGYEDIFVMVSGQSTNCVLYKNNGNGTFTNVTTQANLGGLVMLQAAWADYDNNGTMDLYTTGATSAGNHLFKNNGSAGRHWLRIKLVGSFSNKAGIGAQIEVKSGTLKMMREINTGVGYRSQNMLPAHFGLNTNTTADTVLVRWPSGRRTTLTNVSVDRVVTISEPTTGVEEQTVVPMSFSLDQNYPNPFNPATHIRFTVPEEGNVSLKVYDLLGREVVTLVNEVRTAGAYAHEWNGRNALGANVSSGVYIYRLQSNSIRDNHATMISKRMILMR
jgi:hypothetical protein